MKSAEWIDLAEDMNNWRTVAKRVIKLLGPKYAVNMLASWETIRFSQNILHHFLIFCNAEWVAQGALSRNATLPIPVAETQACGPLLARIAATNPAGGMDICFLRRPEHSFTEVLPTAFVFCVIKCNSNQPHYNETRRRGSNMKTYKVWGSTVKLPQRLF